MPVVIPNIERFPAVANRSAVFVLLLLAASLPAQSQDQPASQSAKSQKQLVLHKVTTAPLIDGSIDDVWSTADSISGFQQFSPYHGQPPTRKTIARVLTTEQALYCLIVCFDEKQNIQQNTGMLDAFGGDVVSLMLDTFGDRKTAYKFAVTASGVRSDCRLLDDARNRDYSWDGVWFADAQVYDWGFVVEMEIPYRSIQYDENPRKWGLDFDRWIPAQTEDQYWCEYEENEGQRISKFGSLLFEDFYPSVRGLSLELYPVGIVKAEYQPGDTYLVTPQAGIDIFYNPSPMLTFSATANPDFAQIEADPYDFNITRYESYFEERRSFFTEGNEIFMASGRQQNMGFYQPLEMFYSRRIGRILPDGATVPLIAGAKAFGRVSDWEYGGFVSMTGETDYVDDEEHLTEERATFTSVRLKRQIKGNSTAGVLFVGKFAQTYNNGVIDIDGAFRDSDWQLAWQVARSFRNSSGDFAASAGFTQVGDHWVTLVRGRYIGDDFDVDEVGFVPWHGTAEFVAIAGPRWYYAEGSVKSVFVYGGPGLTYEKVDAYTDHALVLGYNMQFRSNWGWELNAMAGRSRAEGITYDFNYFSASAWFHTHPKWNGSIWGGYSYDYNFSREYVAGYSWLGSQIAWRPADILELGTSINTYVEGNPEGEIEDITLNARPYFALTPLNDLSLRMYVDNVYTKSSQQMKQIILGFLFSWNFSPKSWLHFAVNDLQDRSERYDSSGKLLPSQMHVQNRVAVFKVRYLYYF